MSNDHSSVRIAVGPVGHPWHGGAVDAVRRGGATIAEIAEAEALIWLGLSEDDLGAVLHSGIRWVQLGSAGVEVWINRGEIDGQRVFTSARGAYSQAVGEHTVALIFTAARRLHVCARARSWDAQAGEGRLLRGSTVGIIGTGGIGTEVIRYLTPFEVRFLAVTRSGRDIPGAESLPASRMDEVWPQVDYLVISAPATVETAGLIGRRELAAMPNHAWIVNVARGLLVDTEALVEALRDGSIGGAALDVTDPEPLPDDHPLWDLPNVLITPHVANPTTGLRICLEERIEANVARFVRGEPLLGIVDLVAGY